MIKIREVINGKVYLDSDKEWTCVLRKSEVFSRGNKWSSFYRRTKFLSIYQSVISMVIYYLEKRKRKKYRFDRRYSTIFPNKTVVYLIVFSFLPFVRAFEKKRGKKKKEETKIKVKITRKWELVLEGLEKG